MGCYPSLPYNQGAVGMPNTFAPNGFSCQTMTGTIGSFDYSKKYISPANTQQIFYGDVVVQLNTGFIRQKAPGEAVQIAGIFMGCEYASVSQGRTVFSPFWPGSDAQPGSSIEAKVITSPNFLFRVQSGPGTATLPLGPTGYDINFDIGYGIGNGTGGNGNIRTGFSTAFIDTTTASPSVTTRPFRVLDYAPGVDGTINGYDQTAPFNIVMVALNYADTRVLTGTVTAV